MMIPSAPSEIDFVVFDWDGTVVDSTGAIADSIRAAARDLELEEPNAQQASHVIGLGLQDALRLAVPSLPPERLREFVERYRVHYFGRDPSLKLFDGMREMLDALRASGVAMGVATGKSRVGLERAFEQTGLRRHFDATRCADEGEPKPHPWMLRDLCEELGFMPSRTLMIGDTTHDHGMAQAAGAFFGGVGYGAHPRETLLAAGVDPVHDSVQALGEWLEVRLSRNFLSQ
jgi:phosphoglycolate phosphatase